MAARLQSPNSINTYNQCPRKYFYNYILKIEKKIPSIHLQRGKIVHSALEDFFKVDISKINPDHYEFELKIILQNLFKEKWKDSKVKLLEIDLKKDQLDFYYEETLLMINNWMDNFLKNFKNKIKKYNFVNAFNILKNINFNISLNHFLFLNWYKRR